VHGGVLGAKVAPLEPVYGTQVALLAFRQPALVQELARTVAVPDVDVFGTQRVGVGVPADEPQQLLGLFD